MNTHGHLVGSVLALAVAASLSAAALPATALSADNAALVADLGSRSRSTAQRARETLLAQGPQAVPAVIAALDDANIELKVTAIQILGELKAKDAVPRLIEELKAENMELRLTSAFSLGAIGDSRATPHLLAMLGAPGAPGELGADANIGKGLALYALGYLGDTAAVARVKELLADPDQQIRIAAASTLGMLGNTDGLEEALSGTASADPTSILASIQALGRIGDKRALPRLEELSRNPNIPWKSDIQLSVRQIDYANAEAAARIEMLGGAIVDQSSNVVEWAIATLADLATPEAVALLEQKARSAANREGAMAQLKLKILGK